MAKIRVGFGFDVHRLVEDRELWLGGIRLDMDGMRLDGTVRARLDGIRAGLDSLTL